MEVLQFTLEPESIFNEHIALHKVIAEVKEASELPENALDIQEIMEKGFHQQRRIINFHNLALKMFDDAHG